MAEYGMTGAPAVIGLIVAVGVFGFILYKMFWKTNRGAEIVDDITRAKNRVETRAKGEKKSGDGFTGK